MRKNRVTGSVAVRAEPRHYLGDVLVDLGIIAGLCLDTLLGRPAAHPTLAMVITVCLLYNGGRLVGIHAD